MKGADEVPRLIEDAMSRPEPLPFLRNAKLLTHG